MATLRFQCEKCHRVEAVHVPDRATDVKITCVCGEGVRATYAVPKSRVVVARDSIGCCDFVAHGTPDEVQAAYEKHLREAHQLS